MNWALYGLGPCSKWVLIMNFIIYIYLCVKCLIKVREKENEIRSKCPKMAYLLYVVKEKRQGQCGKLHNEVNKEIEKEKEI